MTVRPPTPAEMRLRTYQPNTWGLAVFGRPPAPWFTSLDPAHRHALEQALINTLPESVNLEVPHG